MVLHFMVYVYLKSRREKPETVNWFNAAAYVKLHNIIPLDIFWYCMALKFRLCNINALADPRE
jgi:hypothetical protein